MYWSDIVHSTNHPCCASCVYLEEGWDEWKCSKHEVTIPAGDDACGNQDDYASDELQRYTHVCDDWEK